VLHASLSEFLVSRWIFVFLAIQIFIFVFSLYWSTHHYRRKKIILHTLNLFNSGQEQIYELGELAKYIVKFFTDVVGCPKGALFLYSRQRNELRLSAFYGLEKPEDFPPLVTGNVSTWNLQLKKPFVSMEECKTPFFEEAFPSLYQRLEREGFSHLIPLTERGFLLGLVAVGGGVKSLPEDVLEPLSTVAARSVESLYLYESSVTDETTGLYNKRFFRQTLQAELRRSDRYQQSCSLLALDIDNFKMINDTYGHPQGDRVLKALAGLLEECLREGIDIAARTGGEEFHVILPATDAHRAFKIGERICFLVREKKFPGFPNPHKVTVSIGMASYPLHAQNEADLISVADKALYLAKARGKDRICSASELDSNPENILGANSQGSRLNIVDPTTSLFNAEYFFIRLKEELKRSNRYQSRCSLIVLGFHSRQKRASFDAMRFFPLKLRESLRFGIDTPAVLDREHIGIILPETQKEKAGIMAQRIIGLSKEEVIAAGVACFPDDAVTAEDLLAKAMQALKEAQKKMEGEKRCVLWKE
jgi:diguanylate cyclase (GGDEF)-like protein